MRLRSGTSGFSYAEWKGTFYPEKARSKDFLRLFAAQIDCVEINNTFYRMPKPALFEGWTQEVPEGFSFVLKASQRITHHQKLENSAENVAYLWQVAQSLGQRLGPVLFQLPPYLRKDVERLKRFVAALPAGMRAVIEFRHRSWFEDEAACDALREHGVALCFSDVDAKSEDDPGLEQPFLNTAEFGYLRLRREEYDADGLRAWIDKARSQPWRELFVFFKHEPTAPRYALELRALWDAAAPVGVADATA
ncbi:MAG TPA: DUF72 domain-containing protein [Polyangiales bacterium]